MDALFRAYSADSNGLANGNRRYRSTYSEATALVVAGGVPGAAEQESGAAPVSVLARKSLQMQSERHDAALPGKSGTISLQANPVWHRLSPTFDASRSSPPAQS